MPETNDALLDVQRLGRYVTDERPLLFPLSFFVHPHDSIVCQGRTGAGKTVLLRCIAMLDRVVGQIRWRGQLVEPGHVPTYRANVMYVSQRPSFGEGGVRSALQEHFAWRAHHGKVYEESLAIAYLEELGQTARLLDAQASDLSGGESQVMAIVRALLLEPTVLLLDEPTSALDDETTRRYEDLIERWRKQAPRAAIWVTHAADQAARIANRYFVADAGRWSTDV